MITSIDLDHMDYLGPDRESIGREKAGIMRTGRPAIVSDPVPPQSVLDHAVAIGADLWPLGRDFNFSGDKQQWAWAGRGRRYAGLAYPALRGANQLINASGVLAALEALRQSAADHGAGGAQRAGHGGTAGALPDRARAAGAGARRRAQPAFGRRAGGQSRRDGLLSDHACACSARWPTRTWRPCSRKIGPLIDRWYFTDLPTPRADTCGAAARAMAGAEQARATWRASTHADPMEALQAAVAAADPADRIVVFGSFFTVGGVLKDGIPRLQAKHLG